MGRITRRGMFSRAGQAAGTLAALQVAGVSVAQAGVVSQAAVSLLI